MFPGRLFSRFTSQTPGLNFMIDITELQLKNAKN